MSHLDEFKQNKEWMEKQKPICDFILNKMKIPDVTQEMLLTILAIDSINGRTSKINFSNKLLLKLKLSKNVNDRNWSPKLMILNDLKKKDLDDS